MPRKTDAKERMIEAARELFQRQGYHGTGLKQILQESGAPRGSLYFHFPGGKEELAIAAIASSSGPIQERFRGLAEATSPRQILEVVAETLARELEDSAFEKGCPVATVALEMPEGSEPLIAACAEHYEIYRGAIAARMRGFGASEELAEAASWFVLSAFEGALILAKVHRSTAPLLRARDELILWLEARLSEP